MSTPQRPHPALIAATQALAAVAAIGALRLIGRRRPREAAPPTARTITVLGQGAVAVAPDQARVNVGIHVAAATAREASDRGTAAMQRVLDALKAEGVAERQTQTDYFRMMPDHYTGPDRSLDHRYSVHNTVTAIIPSVERVGAVLDAVIEAGGDDVTINNVQLMLSDPAPAHAEARRAALADAREQADAITREMGLTLGEPVAIQPQQGNVITRQMAARGPGHFAAHSAAVPIEPGEMQVTAAVEVVYSLR
ncbi:MAG TPA: SIMPL domain-containing protein [Ktedonobacterales bacterium]|jgi:hypothetical protein